LGPSLILRVSIVCAAACVLPTLVVAAPAPARIVTPGRDAVIVGRSIPIHIAVAPGARLVGVRLNGRVVRGTAGTRVWRASVDAGDGLLPGRNLLRYVARRGRAQMVGSVRFDHGRLDQSLARLTVSRAPGRPLRVSATVSRPDAQFRAWLNGRRVHIARSLKAPRSARTLLGASQGLRIGTNVVRVLVTEPGGRVDVETRRVSIRGPHPIAGAGKDVSTRVGLGVRLAAAVRPHGAVSQAREHGAQAAPAVTYNWTVTDAPDGATPVLSDPTSPTPTLVPDTAGAYTLKVSVTDTAGNVASDEQVTTALPASALVPIQTASTMGPTTGITIGDDILGVPTASLTGGAGYLIVASVGRAVLGTPQVLTADVLATPADVATSVAGASPKIAALQPSSLVIVSYTPPAGQPAASSKDALQRALAGIGGYPDTNSEAPFSLVGVPGFSAGTAARDPGTPGGGMSGYLALSPQGTKSSTPVYGYIDNDKLPVQVTAGGAGETASITVNGTTTSSPAGLPGLLVALVDPATGAGTPQFYSTGLGLGAVAAQQDLAGDLAAAPDGQILLVAGAGAWMPRPTDTVTSEVRGRPAVLRSSVDAPSIATILKRIEAAGGTTNAFGFSAVPSLKLWSPAMAASAGVNLGGATSQPYGLVGVIGGGTGIESSPVIPPGTSSGAVVAELRRDASGRFGNPVGGPGTGPLAPSLVDVAYQSPVAWSLDSTDAQQALEGLAAEILSSSGIPYTGSAAGALRAAYLNRTQFEGLRTGFLGPCPPTVVTPGDAALCQLNAELSAISSLDGYLDNLRAAITTAELAESGSAAGVADDIVASLKPPPSSNTLFKITRVMTDVATVAAVAAAAGGQPEAAGTLRSVAGLGTLAQRMMQKDDGTPGASVPTQANKLTGTINDTLYQQTLMLDMMRDAIVSDRGRLGAFSQARGTAFSWTDEVAGDTTGALRQSIRTQVYAGLVPLSVGVASFPDVPKLGPLWPGVACLSKWASREKVPDVYRWYRLVGFNASGPAWDARSLHTPTESAAVTAPVFTAPGAGGLGLPTARFYADAYGTGPANASDEYGHYEYYYTQDGTQSKDWTATSPYTSCWGNRTRPRHVTS
jgi:hypothetical protein